MAAVRGVRRLDEVTVEFARLPEGAWPPEIAGDDLVTIYSRRRPDLARVLTGTEPPQVRA
jgi:hypothetical protein